MAKSQEKSITFANFKGLNLNNADTLRDGEFQRLVNFDFNKLSRLVCRKGNTLYDDFEATAAPYTMVNIPASTEIQLIQVGTTIYLNSGAEMGGAGNGACTADRQTAVYYMGKVWIGPGRLDGGVTKLLIYNPTTNTTSMLSPGVAGPDNIKYLTVHKDRIWAANGSRLYFSEPYLNDADGDEDDWNPGTNFIDISPDDGSTIIGLSSSPEGLLIFKSDQRVFILTGAYADEFVIPQTPFSNKGPLSHWCVAANQSLNSPLSIYWLSNDDAYRYVGGVVTAVSDAIQIRSEIELIPVSQTVRNDICAVIAGTDYIVSIRQTGYTINNKTFLYDTLRGHWREYEGAALLFRASCIKQDGTWLTAQVSPGMDSKYRLLTQRSGYADTVTESGDVKITADAMTREVLASTGYLDAQFKRLFAHIAFGDRMAITVMVRPTLRCSRRDFYAKVIEFIQESGAVSSASTVWDNNNWADDDDTIETDELVWADESVVDNSIIDEYGPKTFCLNGRSVTLVFNCSYKTDPSVAIERLTVHYLNKRRF